MRATDILNEIKQEAEHKIYQINLINTEKLNKIKLELITNTNKAETNIKDIAEKDIIQTEKQMLGRARLAQKLKLMQKRKELIITVVDESVSAYLKSKDYDLFLKKAFTKNYKKGMTVSIKKGDKKAENLLKTKKIKPQYTSIQGGFLFTDKKMHINKSFDLHLEIKLEEIERDIADLLKF